MAVQVRRQREPSTAPAGPATTDQDLQRLIEVLRAAQRGDTGVRFSTRKRGIVGELARAFNELASTHEQTTQELTKLARVIGKEGRLTERASAQGLGGTWKEQIDAVNAVVDDLVRPTVEVGRVIDAVAQGDLTQTMAMTIEGQPVKGELLRIGTTVNSMVAQLSSFADEVTRVARDVGTEGQLGGQAKVKGVSGIWKALTDNVNGMAENLTTQVRNIAEVTTAVARGDLTKKITVEARGEVLELKNTINTMVDQLSSFADEVTRVAREVGTEGQLGGQANVKGASGTWKDLTDNVNFMATNLTTQVRGIAKVVTAVADGDLNQKFTIEAKGEVATLADTINSMIDRLRVFAAEVTRVAREVGTEGKLGGQAEVEGVSGTWRSLTESVNGMADNLSQQVRNIAEVTTAVATGDLSKKITVDAKGEILRLKNTINTMVDQLSAFADEVTRVAREVGTEGQLGGQANVKGASGTWKDLTDNVNFMATNLTTQVRGIAKVVTAVADGDLNQKFTIEAQGEVATLADTINSMIDRLRVFADQVTGVAREVGTEGKLGGQAEVEGVAGTWKALTDNVNSMAENLTGQVRGIAKVVTAVADGDLNQKFTIEAKGEVATLADTINTMVDQLSSFAAEVTRVACEVGVEGRLGGQATVEGVSGVWRGLTDNVNLMVRNLTHQVRNTAEVTTAVAQGDLSKKVTADAVGEFLVQKSTINTMVDQLSSFADEVTRVAREVGTEGKLGGQADVKGVSGTWKHLTDNVNTLADNLSTQVRNIAEVTTAVANGDLSKKITVDAKGEVLELKSTINVMVDQLSSFAAEVTRVAREVGTEGRLGGQAQVSGVSGVWRGLTENVNTLADNLSTQVRNIAEVTTAVAQGELSKKITVDAKGEVLALKNTINTMVDQLSSFAAEVTRVAKEVGTEGILGGQAQVEGVSGVWRGLTENVNTLAGTLTTQLRAIAEVSTAVTQGDLTRSITVDAQGEVEELKDTINLMISNLRVTTEVNAQQDWLNTNTARFSGMLQGQRDLKTVSRLVMNELTPLVSAQHGAFYLLETQEEADSELRLVASYAFKRRKGVSNTFALGEGLVGQAALEGKTILVTQAPADYVAIASGLGEATPVNIIDLPVVFEDHVLAVIELASFQPFNETHQQFLEQLSETLGVVLNTILANMRTEELLLQSQSLTLELQSQSEELQAQRDTLERTNRELEEQAKSLTASEELLQVQREELQQTNEELEEKAQLLEEQNARIEQKNSEVEAARVALEEKAAQLALTSKYKSEFLANMSHELRTPLNSLLILAKLLSDNPGGNLTAKQIEFSSTIHNAGSDLLALINDILDLSKVEAGKMDVEPEDVALDRVADYVQRTFRPLADEQKLEFAVVVDEGAPSSVRTDEGRLQQILKNLLSNAFKFTEEGTVELRIAPAPAGLQFASESLARADEIVGFTVYDTGIGISEDKLRLIFEAFQQADGTTSRSYGGTGLGLSISREIARLLGGEIRVESVPSTGSTFTLYLPATYVPATSPAEAAETQFQILGDFATALGPIVGGNGRSPATAVVEVPVVAAIEDVVGDDREEIQGDDRVVLIIEDDVTFARTELEIARDRGFKGIVATRGDHGVALAHEYRPDAIILDMGLPVTDGWQVLEHLKRHPETRHIPVHIVSGTTDGQPDARRSGAVAVLEKPVSKEELEDAFGSLEQFIERGVRNLLVVEDDENQRNAIVELIGGSDDVAITAVGSCEAALTELEQQPYDCIVLDLKLPGASGYDLLETIKRDERFQSVPVIVYTGKELTRKDETRLRRYAETIIVKDARSPERLLDETALFLHRVESKLPEEKRRMLEQLHSADAVFEDKQILIVDDDVRNVFALASVLEAAGMHVRFAENGVEALQLLEESPEIDLVLMDVMMPEMDGHEATRRIRAQARFAQLPIIALTAKAMKGDREQTIAAGASDYIPKPVDTDQLLSLMRVWLYR